MLSLFSIFIVELVSFRWGTAKLSALNVAHGTEIITSEGGSGGAILFEKTDSESAVQATIVDGNVVAQIIGLFILEFGLLLHRRAAHFNNNSMTDQRSVFSLDSHLRSTLLSRSSSLS